MGERVYSISAFEKQADGIPQRLRKPDVCSISFSFFFFSSSSPSVSMPSSFKWVLSPPVERVMCLAARENHVTLIQRPHPPPSSHSPPHNPPQLREEGGWGLKVIWELCGHKDRQVFVYLFAHFNDLSCGFVWRWSVICHIAGTSRRAPVIYQLNTTGTSSRVNSGYDATQDPKVWSMSSQTNLTQVKHPGIVLWIVHLHPDWY